MGGESAVLARRFMLLDRKLKVLDPRTNDDERLLLVSISSCGTCDEASNGS